MNENKGAKGGSRDSRLRRFFIRFRKKKLEEINLVRVSKSKDEEKKKKETILGSLVVGPAKILDNGISKDNNVVDKKVNINLDDKISTDILSNNVLVNQSKVHNNNIKDQNTNSIDSIRLSKDKVIEEDKNKSAIDKDSSKLKDKTPSVIIIDDLIKEEKVNETKSISNSEENKSSEKEYQEFKDVGTIPKDAQAEVKDSLENDGKIQNIIIDIPLDNERENNDDKESIDIKGIILEDRILNYLNNMLKDNQYRLDKYVAEFNLLNKEKDSIILCDDARDASLRLDKLIERIEVIKKELEFIKKSVNLDNSYQLDDSYIIYLMEEYRNKYNQGFDAQALLDIKDNKEYQGLLKQLYDIDKATLNLQDKVDILLDDLETRDKEFEVFKLSLEEEEKSFEEIDKLIKNSDQLLLELKDKIDNSTHVIERVEYVTKKVNHHLDKLLIAYMLLAKNPLLGKTAGLLIKTQASLMLFNRMLNPEIEKKVYNDISVDDYESEIKSGLSSINDVFSLMDKTVDQVSKLKDEFRKQFDSYDIPEYKEAMSKLDKLEKSLDERRTSLVKVKDDFDKELIKNNAKVKKLEYPL